MGHVGVTRPRAEPDVTLELRVERCHRGGQSLDATAQQPKEWRQVVELPPIRPVVYEVIAYEAACPHWGEKQQTAFPPGFAAPQALGPCLRAAITYLYALHHIPYQRLQSILVGLFGLKVAVGSLAHAGNQLGREGQKPKGRPLVCVGAMGGRPCAAPVRCNPVACIAPRDASAHRFRYFLLGSCNARRCPSASHAQASRLPTR